MPDDLELPESFVPLQRAYNTAHAAALAHVAAIDLPGERVEWTEEQSEELQRLRDAQEAARKAL